MPHFSADSQTKQIRFKRFVSRVCEQWHASALQLLHYTFHTPGGGSEQFFLEEGFIAELAHKCHLS